MSADSSPFRPQPTQEVNDLLRTLEAAASKGKDTDPKPPYKIKKHTYSVAGTPHKVDSWKFQDWDYKKRDLPTYARGLFTYCHPDNGDYEIVTRGYDKFFNIDEVSRTKWDWIEENTKAPYELTLKENGCIIFISGLPDGTLLVCSKHSTGAREEVSHATVGEKWIDKQLAKLGRTRLDLATALRKANATAVAELCDDSFEEHILPYEEELAGLYLHGVNLNIPNFTTYSASEVHKFAEEWGFRKTEYLTKNDVEGLREFLEEAAETGTWDGKDVEGFVIRCKARNGPNDPDWHDWFFKFKFEEPYLMYRQWREVTKAFISGRDPKYKKHHSITKEYIDFAKQYFSKNPEMAEKYMDNHGIIALRSLFLAHTGKKGSDIIKEEEAEEEGDIREKVQGNVVLVPIATIGCGKTTVAHALTNLFGWGHVQNDNINVPRSKPVAFSRAVNEEMKKQPVVIADRNNHQKREREQLIRDVGKGCYSARFIALHYVHDKPDVDSRTLRNQIKESNRRRVFARGDNHQTIQAASQKHIVDKIMDGFLGRFEPVDVDRQPDSDFDLVIDLDPQADSRKNLEIVVTSLKSYYPNLIEELPTPEEYDEAIESAINEYVPEARHSVSHSGGNKPKAIHAAKGKIPAPRVNTPLPPKPKRAIEYFGISLPSNPILQLLETTFSSTPPEIQSFWTHLHEIKRIQPAFHVTMIHRSATKTNPDLWTKYNLLLDSVPADHGLILGKAKVKLEKIAWDGRVMAIEVSLVANDIQLPCDNPVPHATIGTAAKDIAPVESNTLLQRMKMNDANVHFLEICGDVVLEGSVGAVLSRKW